MSVYLTDFYQFIAKTFMTPFYLENTGEIFIAPSHWSIKYTWIILATGSGETVASDSHVEPWNISRILSIPLIIDVDILNLYAYDMRCE